MKKLINIFSNIKKNTFFEEILIDYKINFLPILDLNKNNNDVGGIIFDNNNLTNLEFDNFKKKYLIITSQNLNVKSLNKKIKILKAPATLNEIKNNIEDFLLNKELEFKDIVLNDRKLSNHLLKKMCFLTDIENEILLYLIQSDDCTKEYIQENILNIKSIIETNSVDSHLTRIRKKLNKIESKLLIKSKFNKVNLTINQKK